MKALEWLRVLLTAGAEVASMVREARQKGDMRPIAEVVADMQRRAAERKRERDELDRRAREKFGG